MRATAWGVMHGVPAHGRHYATVVAEWEEACRERIEARDAECLAKGREPDGRRRFVPVIEQCGDFDRIGFWVCAGADGPETERLVFGGHELYPPMHSPATTAKVVAGSPEYARARRGCAIGWRRFARWCAKRGFTLGVPALWRMVLSRGANHATDFAPVSGEDGSVTQPNRVLWLEECPLFPYPPDGGRAMKSKTFKYVRYGLRPGYIRVQKSIDGAMVPYRDHRFDWRALTQASMARSMGAGTYHLELMSTAENHNGSNDRMLTRTLVITEEEAEQERPAPAVQPPRPPKAAKDAATAESFGEPRSDVYEEVQRLRGLLGEKERELDGWRSDHPRCHTGMGDRYWLGWPDAEGDWWAYLRPTSCTVADLRLVRAERRGEELVVIDGSSVFTPAQASSWGHRFLPYGRLALRLNLGARRQPIGPR